MSDTDATGFAKFVPGFDFLQNLAKGAGASVAHMPPMGNWVAPTLNVEELDKRIEELKNVQFWLEQNSRALAATIQALEVQRMTLATLKGMNFDLGDLASAFQMKGGDAADNRAHTASENPAAQAADAPAAATPPKAEKKAAKAAPKSASAPAPAAMGDPLQLWGALTQQFQQIAANALQEVSAKAGIDLSKNMAAAQSMAAATRKESKKASPAAAKKSTSKKAAARKPASRKASGR